MINEKDTQKLIIAGHTADFLVGDLRGLVKSDNPLLSEIALEILQHAVQIQQRLNRLLSITKVAL